MPSYEIPTFHSSVDTERVAITVEDHRLQPTVLFEMLSEIAFRGYNISVPKDENMYLRRLPDEPRVRTVETKLELPVAKERTDELIDQFRITAEGLKKVSKRQYWALIQHATRRAVEDDHHTT